MGKRVCSLTSRRTPEYESDCDSNCIQSRQAGMNDTPETPSDFDERIVDIVRQHWKRNKRPLLLSQLGAKDGGAIASTAKRHAGSLKTYLEERLPESLTVIRHSSIGAMIGVVPFDAEISDQGVDALFVRSSSPASTKYHFAFLLAFRKPLPESRRRFIRVDGPPHFQDLEQGEEKPKGFLEIPRDCISEQNSDEAHVQEAAEEWISESGLSTAPFLWSSGTKPVEFPSNDLLGRVLQSIDPKDRSRVSLPLDIVFKLRNEQV